MAGLPLTNLTKVYSDKGGKEVTALRGLNLEIPDRDFLVLAGPANCGLSSVIRIIAGLDDPSNGDILIGGRRVNDLPPKKRSVAVVFQNHPLYPGMSVYSHLAFGLKQRRFSDAEIRKRVLTAAETIGLTQVLEQKAKSLSPEQRQRVAIARAAALQPDVLLLDEALAGLTPTARVAIYEEIIKLHQRLRATVIYATHDPIEAMAIGNRMILIRDGKVEQQGTARALYDDPENVFVASFLGNPSMNFIRGELKKDRDFLRFAEAEEGTIDIRWPLSDFTKPQDLLGKEVLLGIRPRDVQFATSPPLKSEKDSAVFPAIIDFIERGDGGANLYVHTGAHRVVCRTDWTTDDFEGGRRLDFRLNKGKVCLFDPLSGQRLLGTKIISFAP